MLRGCFRIKFLFVAVFLIFTSFLICGPAISEETLPSADKTTTVHSEASESGGESAVEKDRSADLIDLLYRFICFAILVTILVVVVKKARVSNYLSERSEEIRNRLEDLRKGKEEAERKYKEIEDQLKAFESKRNGMLEEYRKEGLAERDRIINEAKERVKQIIAQSEAALEQEIRSVRNRLKQDIAEMAIGQATEIIQKEINEKDHDDLINAFIERVRRIN
jgi:F-type H+-transporting ATPase subunit b